MLKIRLFKFVTLEALPDDVPELCDDVVVLRVEMRPTPTVYSVDTDLEEVVD